MSDKHVNEVNVNLLLVLKNKNRFKYSTVLQISRQTFKTDNIHKAAVFWDVAPCRSGVNRRFGGTYRLHLQGRGERKENPHAKRPSETLKAVC
jgi:hypothetical protein